MKRGLGLIALLAFVMLVGFVAVIGRAREGVRGLTTNLASEVAWVEQDPHQRTPHVSNPDLRSFDELLAPHLDGLREANLLETGLTIADRESAEAVSRGKEPVSHLTAGAREWLEAGRLPAGGALAATHAVMARQPEVMRLVLLGGGGAMDKANLAQDAALKPFRNASRVAAIVIREQLEAGNAPAALRTCIDGLALARDVSHGMGILGAIASSAIAEGLFESCASAIDAAPSNEKRDAVIAFRKIFEGHAPIAESMRQEAVANELFLFSAAISAKDVGEFSPETRAIIQRTPRAGIPGRIRLRLQWIEYRPVRDRMRAAMEWPRAERDVQLAALAKRPRYWLRESQSPLPGFAKLDDYRRCGLASLEGLIRAAEADVERAETGVWRVTGQGEGETRDPVATLTVVTKDDILVLRSPDFPNDVNPDRPKPREVRFHADAR